MFTMLVCLKYNMWKLFQPKCDDLIFGCQDLEQAKGYKIGAKNERSPTSKLQCSMKQEVYSWICGDLTMLWAWNINMNSQITQDFHFEI